MELLNFLSPFEELPMEVTLYKVNKNIFGQDKIELTTRNKLHDYLISPLEVVFLKVESDDFSKNQIAWGDIIIVERTNLRIDGLAVVMINNELFIKKIIHDSNFNTTINEQGKILTCGLDFNYIGTITYSIKSDEEDFLDMVGEELFKVY